MLAEIEFRFCNRELRPGLRVTGIQLDRLLEELSPFLHIVAGLANDQRQAAEISIVGLRIQRRHVGDLLLFAAGEVGLERSRDSLGHFRFHREYVG